MQQYIDSAEIIYNTPNAKVIALGIKKSTGKTNVRLHVVSENGSLSEPLEFSKSQLNKQINRLYDYLNVDHWDLRKIYNYLDEKWYKIPCIEQCDNIGYQRNKDNLITAFMGAKCYNKQGHSILKDEFSSLPKAKDNFNDAVAFLNQYMYGKVKRQIVLAHSLAGALCGMINRNIILALVGTSSTGKTSIQNLGISFFAPHDYSGTVLKWSATQNALIKRMDGLSGVNVLIDDTQLSKIKEFAPIIYSLENGQSIDRLQKGNELCDRYNWSVSIGITAENSLLDTFHDLGAIARMIELPVYNDDLFDNEKQVSDVQHFYKNYYGIIGSSFVQHLLSNYNEESLLEFVNNIGKSMCQTYENRTYDNNVITRHLEGDIAILVASATLANQFMGFAFDIDTLHSSLYQICDENYRSFDENKFEKKVSTDVYDKLIKKVQTYFPDYHKTTHVIVPSAIMKEVLLEYSQSLKVTSASIKRELARQNLLAEKNGTYCWNHTINGKDVTGYKLIIADKTKGKNNES